MKIIMKLTMTMTMATIMTMAMTTMTIIKAMNTLLFQSFQNQTVGMTAILTSGEGPGRIFMIMKMFIVMMMMRSAEPVFLRYRIKKGLRAVKMRLTHIMIHHHQDHLRRVQGIVWDVRPHTTIIIIYNHNDGSDNDDDCHSHNDDEVDKYHHDQ